MNQRSVGLHGSGQEPGAGRRWARALIAYREASTARGAFELMVTAGPFILFWVAAWLAYRYSYALSLAFVAPAAIFAVRLFLIQHDCGHGAFFGNKHANDWVGRVLGVITLTPYDMWRRSHAIHHATAGNLERRGIGDIDTLTVEEYLALPALRRLLYRLYRSPFVMFGIGPAYMFVLQHRWPVGAMRGAGWTPWLSTMATNAGIAALAAGIIWLCGVGPFFLIHLPIMIIAASIGVWLFFVQHQFDETHWARDATWDLHDSALHGSSHYDLPGPLGWLTANIGVHHVHHLSSKIPFYRLKQVLRDHPELSAIGRLTFWDSLACVRLALWDESRRRLISFAELRRAGREGTLQL